MRIRSNGVIKSILATSRPRLRSAKRGIKDWIKIQKEGLRADKGINGEIKVDLGAPEEAK